MLQKHYYKIYFLAIHLNTLFWFFILKKNSFRIFKTSTYYSIQVWIPTFSGKIIYRFTQLF